MWLITTTSLLISQLLWQSCLVGSKKTTQSTVEVTTTPEPEIKSNASQIRTLDCVYQSSLENTQEIARRFLITKAHFPDFNFTIEGGKCSLVNIPEGLQAFCEKRVYDLTMFALPGSRAKVTDMRKGCAYSSKLKRDANSDPINSCTTNTEWGDIITGNFGKFVLNGTEITCRCDKNLCNSVDQRRLGFPVFLLLTTIMSFLVCY